MDSSCSTPKKIVRWLPIFFGVEQDESSGRLYSKKDCPVAAYLRSEGLLHVIVGKAAQSANQTIYIDNDNALAGEEATD